MLTGHNPSFMNNWPSLEKVAFVSAACESYCVPIDVLEADLFGGILFIDYRFDQLIGQISR